MSSTRIMAVLLLATVAACGGGEVESPRREFASDVEECAERMREIYRGMAAAIVGGMSVSTLFTLLLLPSLLQLTSTRSRKAVAEAPMTQGQAS